MIDQSVIGANCKIGQNVVIRRCIIWDDTEIGDNCTIEDSLICDNVVISKGCCIEPGCRIDKNVNVKECVILPRNSLVSCRKVCEGPGASLDFQTETEIDETCFTAGAIM